MISPFCLNRMMGATCVLPACFLRASCMFPSTLLLNVTVVYQNHYFKAKLAGNSHYFANFFRKHAGSIHGCYLRASYCCIINGSCCIKTWSTLLNRQQQHSLVMIASRTFQTVSRLYCWATVRHVKWPFTELRQYCTVWNVRDVIMTWLCYPAAAYSLKYIRMW